MKATLPLLLAVVILGTGCYSDNASPTTHGAHNKPSEVVGGKTTTDVPPATVSGPTTTGAGDVTGGGQTTTYGQSGGQPGGQQTAPIK